MFSARTLLPAALLATLATVARGDIYRWDNGEVIPGTERYTPGPGVDLSNLDLLYADLAGRDLQRARFRSSDLTFATFDSSNLASAHLVFANLSQATLRNVDLSSADLDSANLGNAELSGATIHRAKFNFTHGLTAAQIYATASYQDKDLQGIGMKLVDMHGWNLADQRLDDAEFEVANLNGADLRNASLRGVNFSGADLRNGNISNSDVRGALFSHTRGLNFNTFSRTANYQARDLSEVRFIDQNLTGWDLSGVKLAGTEFDRSTLTGTNFSDADVRDAKLESTTQHGFTAAQLYSTASYKAGDLSGVSLSVCDLRGWMFGGLNMSGVSLGGSQLSGNDLRNVNLNGGSLQHAVLDGADLRGAQLANASLLDSTLLGANLAGAEIRGADFSLTTRSGLTEEQIHSTASYQNGDLSGVKLRENDLSGWDFSGVILSGVDIASSVVEGATFRGAVANGFTHGQFRSTKTSQDGELTDIDLSENDLSGWRFSNSALTNMNFRHTILRGARFDRASFTNTDFAEAVVDGADFTATTSGGFTTEHLYSTTSYQSRQLMGVKLAENDLSGWDFHDQDLTGASFASATLTGTNFSGAVIKDANFSYSADGGFTADQLYSTASYAARDLGGIQFERRDVSGWDFAGQSMPGAVLYQANLAGTDFRAADLNHVELGDATLVGARLSNSNLAFVNAFNANFSGADLRNVNLDRANLNSAILAGANLEGARLAGSRGRFAKFDGANLRSANLENAEFDLSSFANADFSNAVIRGAKFYDDDNGITAEMIYSTASYQDRDLKGVRLRGEMSGWDFSDQDLSGGELDGNIEGASFRNALLVGTKIETGNVEGADFTNARIDQAWIQGWTKEMIISTGSYQLKSLTGVRFYAMQLSGLDLSGQDLTGAIVESDLTRANLSNANLENAQLFGGLYQASLSGAIVRGAQFDPQDNHLTFAQFASTSSYAQGDLPGIGLRYGDLSDWSFAGMDLQNADFSRTTLTNTDFSNSDLSGASFSFADFNGTRLEGAIVRGASFYITTGTSTGSGFTKEILYSTASYQIHDLRDTVLSYNNLSGWSFEDQNLTRANFEDSDLSHANLRSAVLHDARFRQSELIATDLSFADLRGASYLSSSDYSNAITATTIRANGTIFNFDLALGDALKIRDYDGNAEDDAVPIKIYQRMYMSEGSALRMIFDMDPWGSTVSFDENIPVQLGGTLELTFADDVDVATQIGRTIRVFDWTGVEPAGAFTVSSLYPWDVSELYTTGNVTLLLPGDTNGDEVVNLEDLNNVRNNFGLSGEGIAGDTNNDQTVDLTDLNNVRNFFGVTPPAHPMPEPGAFFLAVMACVGCLGLRRLGTRLDRDELGHRGGCR